MNYCKRACEISRDSRLRTSFMRKLCIKQRNLRNSFWELWSAEVRTVNRASYKEYFLQLHFVALAGLCYRRNVKTKVAVALHRKTFWFHRILILLNTFQKGLRFHSLLKCCTPVLILLTIQQSLFFRAVSRLTRFPTFYGTQTFITVLIVAHRLSLFWAERILPASCHGIS